MEGSGEEQGGVARSGLPPPFVIGKNKVVASVIFVPLSAEQQHPEAENSLK